MKLTAKHDEYSLTDIVRAAVYAANKTYGGNIRAEFTGSGKSYINFVLRANNSKVFGARKSVSGRHTPSVSWEAHRDVMRCIFQIVPKARLRTKLYTYRGIADFEVNHGKTADKNVGGSFNPVTMPDLSI